jgi:hypothetical protein
MVNLSDPSAICLALASGLHTFAQKLGSCRPQERLRRCCDILPQYGIYPTEFSEISELPPQYPQAVVDIRERRAKLGLTFRRVGLALWLHEDAKPQNSRLPQF